jgi:hypothetical protein
MNPKSINDICMASNLLLWFIFLMMENSPMMGKYLTLHLFHIVWTSHDSITSNLSEVELKVYAGISATLVARCNYKLFLNTKFNPPRL